MDVYGNVLNCLDPENSIDKCEEYAETSDLVRSSSPYERKIAYVECGGEIFEIVSPDELLSDSEDEREDTDNRHDSNTDRNDTDTDFVGADFVGIGFVANVSRENENNEFPESWNLPCHNPQLQDNEFSDSDTCVAEDTDVDSDGDCVIVDSDTANEPFLNERFFNIRAGTRGDLNKEKNNCPSIKKFGSSEEDKNREDCRSSICREDYEFCNNDTLGNEYHNSDTLDNEFWFSDTLGNEFFNSDSLDQEESDGDSDTDCVMLDTVPNCEPKLNKPISDITAGNKRRFLAKHGKLTVLKNRSNHKKQRGRLSGAQESEKQRNRGDRRHEKPVFGCDLCHRVFTRSWTAKMHRLSHANRTCKLCQREFSSINALQYHTLRKPCRRKLSSINARSARRRFSPRIMQGCSSVPVLYVCLFCDDLFSTAAGLKRHHDSHMESKN